MKFEHHKQEVAPFPKFLIRVIRYTLFALGLIIFSVGLGVLGYRTFSELSWLDSFHQACLILTGMGPVAEMQTTSAKVFDSLYALYSGVAFLTVTAVFFAPIIHRVMHKLHVENAE